MKLVVGAFMRRYLDAAVKAVEDTPSKYAYSWEHGGSQRFFAKHDDRSDNWVAIDKATYDATSPGWSYDGYEEHVFRLCVNQKDFDRVMWKAIIDYHACPQVIVLSCGLVLRQLDPGTVKSGSMMTIDKNSVDQVFYKIWYCVRRYGEYVHRLDAVFAVGDDTIERVRRGDVSSYVEFLTEKGLYPHEVETGRLIDLNFVGKKFKWIAGYGIVCVPNYFEKNLWAIMVKEKRRFAFYAETLDSYCSLYAHSEHFSFFHDLLVSCDRPDLLRSPEYYRSLWRGSD